MIRKKDPPICNDYFVYDTYNNQILNISKTHYYELMKLLKIGLNNYMNLGLSEPSYRDIIFLINKGYFRSNFVKNIKHPQTNQIDNLIQRGLKSLVIQITQECNFKCRYCLYATNNDIERNHEKNEIPFDVAKKGIDYLFAHSVDSNYVNIIFYGGEPLLNFELIKKVIHYSEAKFQCKSVNYFTTVNGSLLTDDVIEFLKKNIILI